MHTLVHSLASHLFGRYPVPRGFAQVWFGGDKPAERTARRWFLEHANGRRFRDIPDLPMKMTRKIERVFLHSPHHLPLRAAMRRAEVLALGGDRALVDAILATPLASDLDNGEFWRSAVQFFIKHADQLTPGQIEAIVEFLYAVRIRPLVNGDGSERLPPPDPNFSLAGRTPASLLRLAGMQGGPDELGVGWPSSGWPSMLLDDELGQWRMVELLDAWSLQHEGQVLRHCVRIYWRDCASGRSRIWSLRWRDDQGPYAPRCTIEVRTRTRTIMQIRGYQNRRVSGRMRELIERWADLAGLRIAQFAW